MKLNYQKNIFFTLVKVISIVLIAGSIGLEVSNIYAVLTHTKVPSSLNPIFWIERFAMAIHFIEGIVAAFYAPSREKMPLQYGTYTFFVGTIGLLELFNKEEN
ncbi:hypothetical protein [Brasilonema sp. UFV-L1]|uniref:hypothetical protein n=1 Tax=Brasilonema sp. UFV-L1 TaxID=2234130 RepID=UPI00145F5090|nr:hypothetical protein [Brasilonema sp. UFV-L1]NMG08973.1 hypothetical protein [Brasilonema sp. UFV-L1]